MMASWAAAADAARGRNAARLYPGIFALPNDPSLQCLHTAMAREDDARGVVRRIRKQHADPAVPLPQPLEHFLWSAFWSLLVGGGGCGGDFPHACTHG
jgi:hypothetical protein